MEHGFSIFWTFVFTQQTVLCDKGAWDLIWNCHVQQQFYFIISEKTFPFLLPYCCLSNFCRRLLVRPALLELRFNFHNHVTCQTFSIAVDWLTSWILHQSFSCHLHKTTFRNKIFRSLFSRFCCHFLLLLFRLLGCAPASSSAAQIISYSEFSSSAFLYTTNYCRKCFDIVYKRLYFWKWWPS